MHSRANCGGFNESISWHFKHSYRLNTFSIHSNPNKNYSCNLTTGWETTSRSAAYHFAEGYGGWEVNGHHYIYNGTIAYEIGITQAIDCNIYDGWWD